MLSCRERSRKTGKGLSRRKKKYRVDVRRLFYMYTNLKARSCPGTTMPAVSKNLPWELTDLRGGSSDQEWSFPRLKNLAEQLRHCRSVPSPVSDDSLTASVGMPASEASRNDLVGFPTKKRAAVLVCLYQGANEEFRVILTKRAGNLSSHSGMVRVLILVVCKCILANSVFLQAIERFGRLGFEGIGSLHVVLNMS